MRLIDADAIEWGEQLVPYGNGKYEYVRIAYMDDIDDLPTIEPERKKGEWIETADGTMCGNCRKFPYDDGEYHIANWHSDFCPNCGADMREIKHAKTIEDLIDLFEPYLTAEELQECIDELKKTDVRGEQE